MNNDKSVTLRTLALSAVLILFISDFYFMYVQLGPFPFRNYFTALISILALIISFSRPLKGQILKYQLPLLYLCMASLYLIGVFMSSGLDPARTYLKDVLKFGAISISCTFLFTFISWRDLVKLLLLILVPTVLVAYLQSFFPHLGWPIREFIDPETYALLCGPGRRPSGLAYYSLSLAEQLMIGFSVILLTLIRRFGLMSRQYLMASFFIFLTLGILNSRGIFIGLILFQAVAILKNVPWKKTNKQAVLFTLILLPLAIWIIKTQTRIFDFEHVNDMVRIDAILIALKVLKGNFFLGIGPEVENLKQVLVEASKGMTSITFPEKVGLITPHNYYINMHLKYGVMGSLLNIFLIVKLWKNGVEGLLFSLPILFSSLFHNGGLLNSSTLCIGLYIGIIMIPKLKEEISEL